MLFTSVNSPPKKKNIFHARETLDVTSHANEFPLVISFYRNFEKVAEYCRTYSDMIPISFVLGFYVNLVVKRWQEMFQSIPSTDTLALFVSNSIHGQVISKVLERK
jgi:Bestrophin, RFP-TM, chloride channel